MTIEYVLTVGINSAPSMLLPADKRKQSKKHSALTPTSLVSPFHFLTFNNKLKGDMLVK